MDEDRRDFFISYTGADRQWAEWVAWQLERAGYSVVIQAWDFEPGANFVVKMRDALESCERTLALVSAAYLLSRYGTDEWTGAFLRDARGRERLLLVRIELCELPHLLRTRGYVDLFGLPADEARARLLASVKVGRRKPAEEPPFPPRSEAPRFPTRELAITNRPSRNPEFSGRGALLRKLHGLLASRSPPEGVQRTAAVHGMGGVGKTQVALEYAHRYGSEYDVVWWIPADPAIAIPGHLANLALRLDLPEVGDSAVMFSALCDELRRRTRWLLIYDNAETYQELKPHVPPVDHGAVLITSQTAAWARATTIRLDVPRQGEAVAMLRRRTRGADKPALAKLADALGNLPLALEQAAAYMDQTKTNPAQYLALFSEFGAELFAVEDPITTEKTVATTWQVALDRLRRNTPAALDLLSLFSYMAPTEIPRDLLPANADAVAAALGTTVRHKLAYNAAISALDRYSLGHATPSSVIVHRLVQAVVRGSLRGDKEQQWVGAAVRLVHAAFPRDLMDVSCWPACALLLPHALSTMEHAERAAVELEVSAELSTDVANYLWGRADLEQARALHERSLRFHESRFGRDHIRVVGALNSVALVLWDLGELQQAQAAHARALAIREREFGGDHRDVASTLNNLGAVLTDLGALPEAQAALERALSIWTERLGAHHPAVALALNNLAVVVGQLGALTRAREMHERALGVWQAPDEGNGAAVRSGARSASLVLSDLGGLAVERAAREAALSARGPSAAGACEEPMLQPGERAVRRDHPATATLLDNLGVVLAGLGQFNKAREVQERALAIREAQLGREHPDVGWSLSNLGTVLADLNDLPAALDAQKRGLRIREDRLGAGHPDVATSLVNLGVVLAASGDFATARSQLQRAGAIREATLGRDHEATQRVNRILAAMDSEAPRR